MSHITNIKWLDEATAWGPGVLVVRWTDACDYFAGVPEEVFLQMNQASDKEDFYFNRLLDWYYCETRENDEASREASESSIEYRSTVRMPLDNGVGNRPG